jgi:hypothetical protein
MATALSSEWSPSKGMLSLDYPGLVNSELQHAIDSAKAATASAAKRTE